jgi:hypothetical protein
VLVCVSVYERNVCVSGYERNVCVLGNLVPGLFVFCVICGMVLGNLVPGLFVLLATPLLSLSNQT